MAKIDFPVATADGQEFIADTGVIYTYIGTPPNGHWTGVSMPDSGQSLDSRFVQVIGDTMTGQLTLPGGGTGTEALQADEINTLITSAEDPLLGNYLRTDVAAGEQVVQSTSSTNFKGSIDTKQRLEFSGSLTDYNSFTEPNICHADYGAGTGPLILQGSLDHNTSIALTGINTGIATNNNATGLSAGFKLDGEAVSNLTDHIAIQSFIGDVPATQTFTRCASKLTHFNVSTANFADARPDEVSGYRISNTLKSDAVAAIYGVKGEMTGAGNAYHLYFNGPAPNYIAGNTYIGGTTARNTFELWKSTLTEEQQEQLEAGTLVAPANVSVPGDGSFARQWYYDQQDAETQAELTAGTLEYPEHLLTANFADTFALGDNTNLNLLSNGRISFKGQNLNNAIDSTPGSEYPPVGITMIGRRQNGINIASGGYSVASFMSSGSLFPFEGAEGNVFANHITASGVLGQGFVDKAASSGSIDILSMRPDVDAAIDYSATNISFVNAQLPGGAYSATKEFNRVWGFSCMNLMEAVDGGEKIGYRSNIQIATGKNNFNFAAVGNAPNFFQGVVETKGGLKVSNASNGLILTSPDGSEWRLTVDNAGVLSTAAV